MRLEATKYLVSTTKFLVWATKFLIRDSKFGSADQKFGNDDQKFHSANHKFVGLKPHQFSFGLTENERQPDEPSQKVRSAFKISMSLLHCFSILRETQFSITDPKKKFDFI